MVGMVPTMPWSMLATPIGPRPVKGRHLKERSQGFRGRITSRRSAAWPSGPPGRSGPAPRAAPGPNGAATQLGLRPAGGSGPQDAPTSRPAQIRTRAHCTSSRHGLGSRGMVGGLARPAGPIGLARKPPTSRWAGAMGGVTSERPRGCRRDQGAVTMGPRGRDQGAVTKGP